MKYYTPTFAEFHEGFEFEVPMYGSDLYSKEIFSINTIQYIFNRDSDGDYLMPDIFRVKLLDREDIESLGWVKNKNINTEKFCFNGRYFLFFNNNMLVISDLDTIGNIIRFQGTIKNKSELRKLMTQLNIE